MCDTTDSYVRHDPSIRATWQETSTRIVRVPLFYARLLHMLHDLRDTTHPCVWYDSIMCDTWHMTSTRIVRMPPSGHSVHDSFICDTTHPDVRHDSSMCVTWLIHVCDMTWDLNTNSTRASIRAFYVRAWLVIRLTSMTPNHYQHTPVLIESINCLRIVNNTVVN